MLACFSSRTHAASGTTLTVSYDAALQAGPLDGRVLLVISRFEKPEPRFAVTFGEETAQAFGVDVDRLPPGAAVVFDASVPGYPRDSLRDIPAGEYWVQAILNRYKTYHLAGGKTVKLPPDRGEGQHWNSKPGNLYSKPRKVTIDPASTTPIEIRLTDKIPPIEPEADTKYIKHVQIESKLLSEFWGEPAYIAAVVLIPEGWAEHPGAHYPLIVEQDHFARGLPSILSFRETPPPADLTGQDKDRARAAFKFYQDWTSGRMPRVLAMSIQHPNPYFDDSYAVNSANIGPYGDAITRELIPEVERRFRGIGQGWARAVYGGSTGGWEALGSQVFYPDFYNGAWVFCPDPIDFRAYMSVNLYQDRNAYYLEGQFARVPRPAMRDPNGLVHATMPSMNRYESVMGTHGRSGEQLDIWQAVFSPSGEDGYPKPIFNKSTGEIDRDVANYWKEHYDLDHIMQRDWKKLGPKLAGKLHFFVGDADSFYLDQAVHLTDEFLSATRDPYFLGSFEYGERKPHCYAGNYDPAVGLNQHYFPQMVRHMEETAPRGADVQSWNY